jgi:hypothetical protein
MKFRLCPNGAMPLFIFYAGLASEQRMSAVGTKQTSILTLNMSAFGGKADIPDPLSNVR